MGESELVKLGSEGLREVLVQSYVESWEEEFEGL